MDAATPPDEITINTPGAELHGFLELPAGAHGLVIFAHGSGSSRHSPRNQFVASTIREGGVGTLLFDLLTPKEEQIDQMTAELRFDIPFLATRLLDVISWVKDQDALQKLHLGLFGSSTGAAAALIAASHSGDVINAVVSRGGRPDLAMKQLPQVTAPTLLIVGAEDDQVIELNRQAYKALGGKKELTIIPNATHLFEEPGTLEQVAEHAKNWFVEYL